jgi:hypothetical protein
LSAADRPGAQNEDEFETKPSSLFFELRRFCGSETAISRLIADRKRRLTTVHPTTSSAARRKVVGSNGGSLEQHAGEELPAGEREGALPCGQQKRTPELRDVVVVVDHVVSELAGAAQT